MRKITVYHGISMNAWYDIFGLDETSAQDRANILESCARIEQTIDHAIATGIKPSRIAIGGFSLGGALALHLVLRSKYKRGFARAIVARDKDTTHTSAQRERNFWQDLSLSLSRDAFATTFQPQKSIF